jgi:hypothetical protein
VLLDFSGMPMSCSIVETLDSVDRTKVRFNLRDGMHPATRRLDAFTMPRAGDVAGRKREKR